MIPGTVTDRSVELRWAAPVTPGGQAARYELLWAIRPIAQAAAGEITTLPLPLLPAASGLPQEIRVDALPENAVVYMVIRSFTSSGLASALSNEVQVHLALRPGFNAISLPGSLAVADISALLGPIVGSCPATGLPVSGRGPVGACGNGETPVVTAYAWDPNVGVAGDFVQVNVTDAIPDPFVPGVGILVFAPGNQAVLNLAGFDVSTFPAVPIPNQAPALVANPFQLPVAVATLRIKGTDVGGALVYDQPFATASAQGVINPELTFLTESGGVLTLVPETQDLLPYRAYFIQLGGAADPTLSYAVEVLHP